MSNSFPNFSRRRWLQTAGCGFGGLSFSALSTLQCLADRDPLAPKRPHFNARAKRVIFLYMHGGASHIDSFDHKPELARQHGKKLPDSINTGRNKFNANLGTIMKSPWDFHPCGQSGLPVSDLFPNVGACVDDLCVIRSMYSDNNAHVPATLELHTGSQSFMRPSIGSWVTYGLGTDNQNLPGFITICPPLTYGGERNFGSAFLPAAFHGTKIGTNRIQVKDANIENIRAGLQADEQRRLLDFIQSGNRDQLDATGSDSKLEARIASFELAFRMQQAGPEAMDLRGESVATKKLYGIDDPVTENYGRELLLARRFIERGVRFVHVAHTGGRGGRWDQHSSLKAGHERNARACDKPISGLLRDLKHRGLLKDTLVVWSTEFGRTPEVQNKNGRGHHAQGFTFWLAGGGVKPGITHGKTDEFGYHAIKNPVSLHDLHATILYLLGLDHERLTYRYSGRDFRLTDVYGRVIREILA
ncbi:MAG: sulfatase [Verrucomicrobiales bacterium]|nr:sulfatase [Verrucomicrobiales bacterium]|tara:strand:- start:845 stop:2263 length:1419 start_codon:yes stop_codon:yes gene_type:complete